MVVDASRANDRPHSLVTVMGNVRREGVWRMRRRTTGFVLMGDVKIRGLRPAPPGSPVVVCAAWS